MAMLFLIWPAMSGSGVVTGMMKTTMGTPSVLLETPKVLITAPIESGGAVAGATVPALCAALIATTAVRASGTALLASAVLSLLKVFYPLFFFPLRFLVFFARGEVVRASCRGAPHCVGAALAAQKGA